ncbi:serine/threonine-protein kinase [Cupriavidus numazuensis]|uniref:Serine/threonine-protein kinase PknD n=1 Tax=Cupriavidus numazuensis TaxID=221992 RepID=A0ABM8TLS1_9BURK|nr:serine/threonine-protein kinase [Cupriavidus numazuensis]CAG2153902.1 Serine/threonine-protein kinase PknD [Cupriavidus numazuensis]
MSPRQIGHYEIRTLLGRGGIGEVYGAFDTELEREVAIKTLRPELSLDKGFLERFRAEATSLARLNHPNITTLYALFRDGDTVCMVMELVRGQTLETMLQRLGKFPVRDSLAVIIQAVMGLRYAHRAGVIHRDIKPSNLMLTDGGTLKIMDFGIARIQGSQRLTRQGDVVGTLAYASPEQLRGNEGDGRSDQYSLATVLYEMLSGRLPFSATSDYELIRAQVETVPPPLAPLCGDLDPQVEGALMQALSKSPQERFETVEEFGRALGASALLADAPDIVRDGIWQAFLAHALQTTRVAPPHTTVRATGQGDAGADAAQTASREADHHATPLFSRPTTLSPATAPMSHTATATVEAPSSPTAVRPDTGRTTTRPPHAPARSRLVVIGAAGTGLVVAAGVLAWALMRQPESAPKPTVATVPVKPAPQPQPPVEETPVNLPPIALVPQPPPPAPTPPANAPPPDLEGSVAQVLDSGALIVSGKIVNLFSIVGEDGRPAKAMQRYLKDKGNRLQCFAKGKAFQCFADGEDIAEHALRSGWARTRAGAPAPYSAAEQEARRARLGVWAT